VGGNHRHSNKIRNVWGILHGGRNFEVRTLRPALQAGV